MVNLFLLEGFHIRPDEELNYLLLLDPMLATAVPSALGMVRILSE
jgi:hypothetical protein